MGFENKSFLVYWTQIKILSVQLHVNLAATLNDKIRDIEKVGITIKEDTRVKLMIDLPAWQVKKIEELMEGNEQHDNILEAMINYALANGFKEAKKKGLLD